FDQHGRKNLPWQENKTAYRVWVSEVMLQQTQVNTVIPYFQRFITRFPDVETLAIANEDDVLHLWTGLGYYQRARHLHKTAKIICESFQGHFPNDLSSLENLPGIGKSTAGAILAIAFEKRAPILDGNVKRVLTRLHGITQWPGEKETLQNLWKIAEEYTPENRIGEYTQAIMDLGATLCVRGKPNCTRCPFNTHCIAYKQNIAPQLPQAKPRKTLPVHEKTLLIIRQKTQYVLLEKRSAAGVWKGLWSLPELLGIANIKEIQKALLTRFHLPITKVTLGAVFRHTFSHYHLDILPAIINIKDCSNKIMDDTQQIWYNLQHNQAVGMPAPVKKLLSHLT
ncbi:MAG: A/G-specific adenine glycosylase, partial [Gammaproteobacteria bacterium]|nr:A/G-specific adenine glycosylase [Gammaproteobacteria bacterium]